jgi:hypothetical protein
MSIETLLAELRDAVDRNTQQLQVIEAGRQASLDQLVKAQGAAAETAPKTRGRKKAEEPAAAPETGVTGEQNPAPGETPAATATTTAPTVDVTAIDNELKQATADYIGGGATDDEKKARTANVVSIMDHFGTKLVGSQSTLDADQKQQALFYVKRFAAGCTVNFSQEYDFAGDPTQGSAAPAEEEFAIG